MHARIRRIRCRRRWRRLLFLQRFRRDERGVQLVEVTIVIPIFLMLFAATAEFGRYFYEYTTLAKAARVGCRYLATNKVDPDIDSNAKKLMVYGNINATGSPILPGLELNDFQITRQGDYPLLPDTVTVTVTGYPHQPIFDLGALTRTVGLSMAVDVKPSVKMRFLLTQPPPIE